MVPCVKSWSMEYGQKWYTVHPGLLSKTLWMIIFNFNLWLWASWTLCRDTRKGCHIRTEGPRFPGSSCVMLPAKQLMELWCEQEINFSLLGHWDLEFYAKTNIDYRFKHIYVGTGLFLLIWHASCIPIPTYSSDVQLGYVPQHIHFPIFCRYFKTQIKY